MNSADKENQKALLSARLKQVSEEREKHLQALREKRIQKHASSNEIPSLIVTDQSKQTKLRLDWFHKKVDLVIKDADGTRIRRVLPPCLKLFRLHQVERLLSDPTNLPIVRVMMACMAVAGQPMRHNLQFDPRYMALQAKIQAMEEALDVPLEVDMEVPQVTLPLPAASSVEEMPKVEELDSELELAAEVEAISQRLELTPPERTRQRRLVMSVAEELTIVTSRPETPSKPREVAAGGSMVKLEVRVRNRLSSVVVVSPVRRSIRLNGSKQARLPEGDDWSYLPNPHL